MGGNDRRPPGLSRWANVLAVFLVLGLGAVLLVPSMTDGGSAQGRAARARALVSAISASLEMYHLAMNTFPPTDPGSPSGSASLARAMRSPDPRDRPFLSSDASMFDAGGNFVNPVWGSGAGPVNGVIHYRNNLGVSAPVEPPPPTAHPAGAVHAGACDLWCTGVDADEVSAINNWGP